MIDFLAGPHADMGTCCQYRVPGVSSDSQMDVFRILRIAFLKSKSAAAGQSETGVACLPLTYEVFAPEQVRPAGSRSASRDLADKMRDTFAKVMTYLRNSGNYFRFLHTYICFILFFSRKSVFVILCFGIVHYTYTFDRRIRNIAPCTILVDNCKPT